MRGSVSERPCDREALALPARERDAALAELGLVAVGEALDELVRLRQPGGALDLLEARLGASEGDVLAHAGREEERILRDHADLRPE